MKQFFEQYGEVALGILALLVLIAMITPVGNIIKTSLQGTVQTFSTKMDGQVDTMTESMNTAFTNATDFTGIKDNKIYINGSIPNNLKDYTLNEAGTFLTNDITGNVLYIRFDLNTKIGNSYYFGGTNGLLFDVYRNDVKIGSSVQDFTYSISARNIDIFKVVPVSVPEGYEVQDVEYKTTLDLMRDYLDRANPNEDLSGADRLHLAWSVNVIQK